MLTSSELKQKLAYFTGSENFYRIPNWNCLITEGVHFFLENAGTFWFLDTVYPDLISLARKKTDEYLFPILLKVEGTKAEIQIFDGDENLLKTKKISFTDCPEGEWKIWFHKDDKIFLLPSEY